MRNGKLIFLVFATASTTLACAPAGWSWSRLPQSTTEAADVKLVPGDWSRVEALLPGARLVITVKSGFRMVGAFRDSRPGVLLLTDSGGDEFSIPRQDVSKISVTSRDDLANGVLVGAGIGLGAAIAILAGLGSGDGYVLPSAKWGAPLILSGAGALLGAAIDHARKGEEILYVAPTTRAP